MATVSGQANLLKSGEGSCLGGEHLNRLHGLFSTCCTGVSLMFPNLLKSRNKRNDSEKKNTAS